MAAMENPKAKGFTRIDRLAETLRDDMHRRALRAGDHYLTAAAAGQMLGVSPMMANRAMNVLAGQRLLVRHRRRGTFVGPAFQPKNAPPTLRVIHIFRGRSKDEVHWRSVIGDCLQGLHTLLPDYQVQSNLLPPHRPTELVREIVKQSVPEGSLSGIVLLSCSREVQEMVQGLVQEHRVPAVSYGTVYPNITEIPSVDQDQFESGRLQAKYLLDRGHERIMLLMHDNWRPGDNLLVAGVNQALADAGLSYGVLGTRSVPDDAASFETEINRLLCLDDRPTGLICRSQFFAQTAREVAKSKSMRVPEDLDIVFNSNDRTISAGARLPHTVAKYSSREQLLLVAEILEELIRGEPLADDRIVVPVELLGPDQ